METGTVTVVAATEAAIESEILALGAQTMPTTGDVLLLLQHEMTEVASVATDMGKILIIYHSILNILALEEDMMIVEAVIDTAAIDTAATDTVETETGATAATDMVVTETEIEATAETEIVVTVIATDLAIEIVTAATDVTTGIEDMEVDTLVPLMTTTNGEEPSPKSQNAIQETKLDETHHESDQNCNYQKDLLMKVKQK